MEESHIKKLYCDRAHVTVTDMIDWKRLKALKSTVEVQSFYDARLKAMCIQLTACLPGVLKEQLVVHERWPETWWDAVKARWFSRRMLKRWPVKWHEININKPLFASVCPHIEIDEPRAHLIYLLNSQEELKDAVEPRSPEVGS